MIWGYIFIALIAAATAYTLYAGDREACIAILTLVGGSALTIAAVYYSGQYYESANGLVALVDFAILGIFLWLSLASRRYWTLCLPALQAIVCITHDGSSPSQKMRCQISRLTSSQRRSPCLARPAR